MVVRVNALDPIKRANGKGQHAINKYVKAVLAARALKLATEWANGEVQVRLRALNGGQLSTAAKILEETVRLGPLVPRTGHDKGLIRGHGDADPPKGDLA